MSLDFEKSLPSLSALDLWFKVTGKQDLYLSDIPELITLRWNYFKDNWEFLKESYSKKISNYQDPQLLKTHIESFSDFVISQRNSKSTKNPFDNSNVVARFYSIFDSTLISSVRLTFEEQQLVSNKIQEVKSYTRGDFLYIRSELQKERDNIADKVGTTDADYNRVFDRSPQAARVAIKNKDINKMLELQEAIKTVDFILANSFSLASSTIDPFALAKANANNPEIDIKTYKSGYLTRLAYGEDLQSLAKRTLGDPTKWIDIAITNGLKPPYIDEVGENISLISNANKNQINIAEVDANNKLNIDKLFVGQIILLQSSTQTFPEQRTVQNITQVPISGEIILELTGEDDLDRYKVNESAYIRIFKPNTVNSSFFIMIPSDAPLDDSTKNDTPWFLQGSDAVEKRQKVDFSLSETGDLTFNSTGDIQLSFGIDNAIQAIKMKMMVESGELRQHPEFGLIQVKGLTNSSISNIRSIITNSIVKMIEADKRFAGIDSLDVSYRSIDSNTAGTTIDVNLIVRLSGSNQLLPITFSINKG